MFDDVVELLGNLGRLNYVNLKCESYVRLVLQVLSRLHIDWAGSYKGKEVFITFRRSSDDVRLSLRDFDELIHLSDHERACRDVPSNWKLDHAWLSITCAKL